MVATTVRLGIGGTILRGAGVNGIAFWALIDGEAVTLAATLTVLSSLTTATATSATSSSPATSATALVFITALATLLATLALGALATLIGAVIIARRVGRSIVGGSPGKGFAFAIPIVFVLVFFAGEVVGRGHGGVGGTTRSGGGDALGFGGEILARGQLDLAGGNAGEFSRAQEARRFGESRRANHEGGDDVAGAGAQEVLDRLGDQFRIDGALGVKRQHCLGRRFGIGAGINSGGADAITAEFVKEGVGEVVETAFDGGGHGAAGGGAIAIPAEDKEVALLFAEPREGDAGEGQRCDETNVDALDERGDGGIEERNGCAARSVNDKTHMALTRYDVLGSLGEGGGVS